MGILEQKNCVRSLNSKIPEYAREYKNEYLFIRGINKELNSFVDIHLISDDIDILRYHGRIKYFIKKFMIYQELGYLKDITNFTFKECDVKNIVYADEHIEPLFNFLEYYGKKYRDFYNIFCKFYNKIKIA